MQGFKLPQSNTTFPYAKSTHTRLRLFDFVLWIDMILCSCRPVRDPCLLTSGSRRDRGGFLWGTGTRHSQPFIRHLIATTGVTQLAPTFSPFENTSLAYLSPFCSAFYRFLRLQEMAVDGSIRQPTWRSLTLSSMPGKDECSGRFQGLPIALVYL